MNLEFDPLNSSEGFDSEIINAAKKREIRNILKSYVGIFDSFSELIQNSLDSVDRRKKVDSRIEKKIWLNIDLSENSFTIIDNGIGFQKKEFEAFLAPNISFKDGSETRGNKGVGATYIAYGFNKLTLGTKNADFNFIGQMINGRKWVEDKEGLVTRPMVRPYSETPKEFNDLDQGTFFKINFGGDYTRPKTLSYFTAIYAEQWIFLLLLKTPLGGIYFDKNSSPTKFHLSVTDNQGNITTIDDRPASYKYPHSKIKASADIKEILETQQSLMNKGKDPSKLPAKFERLNGLYEFFNSDEVKSLPTNKLEPQHHALIDEYSIEAYGYFGYSTQLWDEFNDHLAKLRKGYRVLRGGLLIANNNMLQGDYIAIPLTSNIGYQNQTHVIVHLKNADPDLGRKGFQPEIKELCEYIAVGIVNKLKQWKSKLRNDSGAKPVITTQINLHNWIKEQESHEDSNPLNLSNPNFFKPINEISISSIPQSEQDVIVLFNQLIAGGVIRGIKLLATSQYATYDGIFKYYIKEPRENHLFDKTTNPLGVQELGLPIDTVSNPNVLEYKFNLDALFQEFENEDKFEKDVNLAIAWELGEQWKRNYEITSLLDLDNLHHRQFHGITHIINSKTSSFNLIILKELMDYLHEVDAVQEYHRSTYAESIFE
ncbi:ATP-binding protein [Arenibacter amylolyticus]|uniref:ATP-binding protein n=1 Tax=Arenibacter amylolyticus TaxID=1406873 RepID=UPI000A39F960|nr:ATP-binding protein [Arenibacter amylolyticus]